MSPLKPVEKSVIREARLEGHRASGNHDIEGKSPEVRELETLRGKNRAEGCIKTGARHDVAPGHAFPVERSR